MRSLRDFNIPKIVTDDMPVFMGLIGDLFPTLDVPRRRDLNFEALVRKAVMELKLQAEDNFVLKVHFSCKICLLILYLDNGLYFLLNPKACFSCTDICLLCNNSIHFNNSLLWQPLCGMHGEEYERDRALAIRKFMFKWEE